MLGSSGISSHLKTRTWEESSSRPLPRGDSAAALELWAPPTHYISQQPPRHSHTAAQTTTPRKHRAARPQESEVRGRARLGPGSIAVNPVGISHRVLLKQAPLERPADLRLAEGKQKPGRSQKQGWVIGRVRWSEPGLGVQKACP